MIGEENNDTPKTPDNNPPEGDDNAPESNAEAEPKQFESEKGEDREPLSDDPEVNAIGELDYDEIERIIQDPDDSRQEKAQEYLRLRGEAWSRAAAPLFKGINEQYSDLWKNIIGQSMPRFDMSKFAPKFDFPSMRVEIPPVSGVRAAEAGTSAGHELTPSPLPPKSAKLPEGVMKEAQATTAAILETNKRLSELVRQTESDSASTTALMAATNKRLEEMLQQAKIEAAEQKEVAEKSDKHAVKARRQTWIAVGITLVVGIAQIVIGLVSLNHC